MFNTYVATQSPEFMLAQSVFYCGDWAVVSCCEKKKNRSCFYTAVSEKETGADD